VRVGAGDGVVECVVEGVAGVGEKSGNLVSEYVPVGI
jgi:hypothetical protein